MTAPRKNAHGGRRRNAGRKPKQRIEPDLLDLLTEEMRRELDENAARLSAEWPALVASLGPGPRGL